MSFRIKSVPYLSLLVLSPFLLFAEAEEPINGQKTKKADQMLPGYNAPERFEIQTSRPETFYFTGGFTYWQASQDNMELGFVSDSSDPNYVMNGSFVNMDFDYKPGFQVGAGINFVPDNWDLYFEYTWFRGQNHTQKSLDPVNFYHTLFPTWQAASISAPAYFAGNETWTLHMDIADGELGRNYFVGKNLTLRPFIGLRAPWIRQEAVVNYLKYHITPSVNTEINQISHSWGIGPRFGVLSDWMLGHGLKLYGKAGADVVYTQYTKLSYQQESTVSGAIIDGTGLIYKQEDVNTVRPHVDLTLGFEWGTFFANERAHISLSADYGFQVFFNQNMFRTFIDSLSLAKSISPNGNLYMQGLTATLRVDF